MQGKAGCSKIAATLQLRCRVFARISSVRAVSFTVRGYSHGQRCGGEEEKQQCIPRRAIVQYVKNRGSHAPWRLVQRGLRLADAGAGVVGSGGGVRVVSP